MGTEPVSETELLRQTVRRLVADKVEHADAEADAERRWPHDLWRRLVGLDLAGVLVPAERGGAGGAASTAVVVAEELARGSGSLAWGWLEHTDATWILGALGSEEVKARFLPRLASGELIGSALKATEAGGGSSPAGIANTARAVDGGYVLNGRKVFQSMAGVADIYLVVARIEPAPESGALGVFLVERDCPGLSFGPAERTMGLRGLPIGDIVLDDCRVPDCHVVGAPGGFGAVVGHHARLAPLLVAAIALGLAESSLGETVEFLVSRSVGGEPLASLPAIQLRLADLIIEVEAIRGLLERAEGGRGRPALGALTKVAATEAAARVIDACITLNGAAGYSAALPIERRARDVRALAIHYGTNDQLRLIAARAVLGAFRKEH